MVTAMRYIIIILLIAFGTVPSGAQTIIQETDAAFQHSQELRSDAIKAFRANDLNKAKALMMQALEHRPNSIAILGNAIFISAETGDATTAFELTKKLVTMGVNPAAAVQEKLKTILGPDEWHTLEETIKANAKPLGQAHTLTTIPANHRLVEGIAADNDGTFYFSTVVSGSLLKADTNGNTEVLYDGQSAGLGSFFGIAFNQITNTIFATFATINQTPKHDRNTSDTGVIEVDPITGKLLNKWVLPQGSDGHQIADIAISERGTVFVADAAGNALYKIKDSVLDSIPTTATFMNVQGIVARGEADLLVADYGRGLWRVNTNTGTAILYGVPNNVTVTGIDGLFVHNNRIIAIQNGTSPHRVLEVHLNDQQNIIISTTTLAQNLPIFDEPTLGTSTGDGFIFVASSQWPKFGEGGALREGTTLNPTTILKITGQ